MKNPKLRHNILNFAIVFFVFGIVLSLFLFFKFWFETTTHPTDPKVTNKTDQGFVVSWTTPGIFTKGSVYAYPKNQKWIPGVSRVVQLEYLDVRDEIGEQGRYQTHYVEVKGLEADTEYMVLIQVGNHIYPLGNDDESSTIATYTSFESSSFPQTAYGSITNEFGHLIEGALVYVHMVLPDGQKSNLMSSISSKEGKYTYEPTDARDSSGKFMTEVPGTAHVIAIDAADDGTGAVLSDQDTNKPIRNARIFVADRTSKLYPPSRVEKIEDWQKNAMLSIYDRFAVQAGSDELRDAQYDVDLEWLDFNLGIFAFVALLISVLALGLYTKPTTTSKFVVGFLYFAFLIYFGGGVQIVTLLDVFKKDLIAEQRLQKSQNLNKAIFEKSNALVQGLGMQKNSNIVAADSSTCVDKSKIDSKTGKFQEVDKIYCCLSEHVPNDWKNSNCKFTNDCAYFAGTASECSAICEDAFLNGRVANCNGDTSGNKVSYNHTPIKTPTPTKVPTPTPKPVTSVPTTTATPTESKVETPAASCKYTVSTKSQADRIEAEEGIKCIQQSGGKWCCGGATAPNNNTQPKPASGPTCAWTEYEKRPDKATNKCLSMSNGKWCCEPKPQTPAETVPDPAKFKPTPSTQTNTPICCQSADLKTRKTFENGKCDAMYPLIYSRTACGTATLYPPICCEATSGGTLRTVTDANKCKTGETKKADLACTQITPAAQAQSKPASNTTPTVVYQKVEDPKIGSEVCSVGLEEKVSTKSQKDRLESEDDPWQCRQVNTFYCCTPPSKSKVTPREGRMACENILRSEGSALSRVASLTDTKERNQKYAECLKHWGVDISGEEAQSAQTLRLYNTYKSTPCELCDGANRETCRKYCVAESSRKFLIGNTDTIQEDESCSAGGVQVAYTQNGIKYDKQGKMIPTGAKTCGERHELIDQTLVSVEDPYEVPEGYKKPWNIPKGRRLSELTYIPKDCLKLPNDPMIRLQSLLFGIEETYTLDITCSGARSYTSHPDYQNLEWELEQRREIVKLCQMNPEAPEIVKNIYGRDCEYHFATVADDQFRFPSKHAQFLEIFINTATSPKYGLTIDKILSDPHDPVVRAAAMEANNLYAKESAMNFLESVGLVLGIIGIILGVVAATPVTAVGAVAAGIGIGVAYVKLEDTAEIKEHLEGYIKIEGVINTVDEARQRLNLAGANRDIIVNALIDYNLLTSTTTTDEEIYQKVVVFSKCMQNTADRDPKECAKIPEDIYRLYGVYDRVKFEYYVNFAMLAIEVSGVAGDFYALWSSLRRAASLQKALTTYPHIIQTALDFSGTVDAQILGMMQSAGIPFASNAKLGRYLQVIYQSGLDAGFDSATVIKDMTANFFILRYIFTKPGNFARYMAAMSQISSEIFDTKTLLAEFFVGKYVSEPNSPLLQVVGVDNIKNCINRFNPNDIETAKEFCREELANYLATLTPETLDKLIVEITQAVPEEIQNLLATGKFVMKTEAQIYQTSGVELGYTVSNPFAGGYIKWQSDESGKVYGTTLAGDKITVKDNFLVDQDSNIVADVFLNPNEQFVGEVSGNVSVPGPEASEQQVKKYIDLLKVQSVRRRYAQSKYGVPIEPPRIERGNQIDKLHLGYMGRGGIDLKSANAIYKVEATPLRDFQYTNRINAVRVRPGINVLNIGVIRSQNVAQSYKLIESIKAQSETPRELVDTSYKYIDNSKPILSVQLFEDANANGQKDEGEKDLDLPNTTVSFEQVDDTQVYNLNQGWNLISIPLDVEDDYTASDMLKDIATQGGYATTVSKYENGKWISFKQRGDEIYSNEDFVIEPGVGYFVKMDGKHEFALVGKSLASPAVIKLYEGWNLIALNPSKTREGEYIWNHKLESKNWTSKELLETLRKEGVKADTISEYKDGVYKNYIIADDGQSYGFEFALDPSAGYFVRVEDTTQSTWQP